MSSLILLKDFIATQIEIWRYVEGFPDYEVSNLGRVRSFRESRRSLPIRDRGHKRVPYVVLKPTTSRGSGYPTVNLRVGRFRKQHCPVHRLVAEAFICNPENKPEVNHRTGLKTDSRVSNLEWVTLQENKAHAKEYGLVAKGEKHGMSRLTESDVKRIRELRRAGLTLQQISNEIGNISFHMVSRIVNNKNWKHVT